MNCWCVWFAADLQFSRSTQSLIREVISTPYCVLQFSIFLLHFLDLIMGIHHDTLQKPIQWFV